MSVNNFRSHLWPFQIDMQLFFFTKWPPAAILVGKDTSPLYRSPICILASEARRFLFEYLTTNPRNDTNLYRPRNGLVMNVCCHFVLIFMFLYNLWVLNNLNTFK